MNSSIFVGKVMVAIFEVQNWLQCVIHGCNGYFRPVIASLIENSCYYKGARQFFWVISDQSRASIDGSGLMSWLELPIKLLEGFEKFYNELTYMSFEVDTYNLKFELIADWLMPFKRLFD